jgi:hypothetical protein
MGGRGNLLDDALKHRCERGKAWQSFVFDRTQDIFTAGVCPEHSEKHVRDANILSKLYNILKC